MASINSTIKLPQTIQVIDGHDVEVSGNVEVQTDVTVGQQLAVTGQADFSGDLVVAGDIQGSVAFAPTAPSDFDVDGFGNARPAPTTQHGALDHLALRAKASEEAIVAEEASRIAADSALQTQADATDARTQPLTFAGDVLAVGSAGTSASLEVFGDMTVHGSTTTLHSTNLSVDDKTLQLARSDAPTDASADGAGIEVQGDSQKSFVWRQSTADGQSNAWQASGSLEVDDSLYVDRLRPTQGASTDVGVVLGELLYSAPEASDYDAVPQYVSGALSEPAGRSRTTEGGLAAEIARAQAAEQANADAVAAESAARTSISSGLQSNIDAEEAARVAGDAGLQASLDAETARATAAEGSEAAARRRRRGAERPRVRRRAAAAEH